MKEIHPSRKLLLAAGIVLSLAATGCARQEQDLRSSIRIKMTPEQVAGEYHYSVDLLSPSGDQKADMEFLNQIPYGQMATYCSDFKEATLSPTNLSGTAACHDLPQAWLR